MLFDLPSPKDLAVAIARTSYSVPEKKNILGKLPFMAKDDIIKLYEALIKLHKAEEAYIQAVDKIDLKYAIEFERAARGK